MALRLIFTKGPRQGETLEFPTCATVRIGRIARGNSLAVKDSGISSKHLAVEPASGKWLLRDLGSSNGTFLNGDLVDPEDAVELRSGDVVKVGEQTSISVEIADGAEPGRPRRNPRVEAPPAKRARVLSSEAEIVEGGEGVGAARLAKRPSTRVTRRAKNVENEMLGSVLGKITESSELGDGNGEVEVAKMAKPSTRRRNNLQQKPPEESEAEVDENGNAWKSGASGSKESSSGEIAAVGLVKRQSRRVTRRAKNVENEIAGSYLGKIPENSELGDGNENVEIAKKVKPSTRRNNLQQKPPECDPVNVADGTENEDGNGNAGKSGGSGWKESGGVVGKELDLEKMTLGEWFDYLEVDFREGIVESTEEVIKGMRLKSKRVHYYAVLQKIEKANVAVV